MRLIYLAPFFIVGCAASPGTRPDDMSASRHEAVADAHEAEAESHARSGSAARDADAGRAACPPTATVAGSVPHICWTAGAQATSDHADAAAVHRRIAAEHRAASRALRDAEARACAGLADDDRDASPFTHTEDISGVAPLVESVRAGRTSVSKTTGASVTFRALPGLTAEWLQRVIDCHLARNAALGHELANMDDCPLVPRGVAARVASTGNGFVVAIRGEDQEAIDAIVLRADKLKARLERR